MMTGMPVITWGPKLGNMINSYDWKNTYEACDIIKNGINGFCFDNQGEIEEHIKLLLSNFNLAQTISKEARKTAISLFSREVVKEQWTQFFKSIL